MMIALRCTIFLQFVYELKKSEHLKIREIDKKNFFVHEQNYNLKPLD